VASIAGSPRVSVGVAVYNGERFLAQALDCLIAQTYRDFELIVCDNGSTDRTEQICRSYAEADGRIRYHRSDINIGAPRNFNLAFTLSRGEYFKWSAADDLCAPTLLQRCVEVLDKRPDVVLCYPRTRLVDEDRKPIRDYEDLLNLQFDSANQRLAHLLWNIRMCNAVFGLMRSATVRRMRLFGVYSNSDVAFLGELALQGIFVEIPEYLFFRSFHEISAHKYPSPYERMAMFAPEKVGHLAFPYWRLFGSFLSAIHRAPLSWTEKMRCYARMRIWLSRWGSGLREDFVVAVRYLIRSRLRVGANV
jgi:glycosyltransferase involved in cell wall biosynthesis